MPKYGVKDAPCWVWPICPLRASALFRVCAGRTRECQPVIRRPHIVETLQTQLSASLVAPKADGVPAAVVAYPGTMEKSHWRFELHLRIFDAKIEGALVVGTLQTLLGSLGGCLF